MPPIRRDNMAARHRGCELAPYERTKLIELKSIGWSYKEIHDRYPSIPISTIKSTWLRSNQKGPSQETLPRSGPPKKLNEEDKENILQAIDDNPCVKYDELLATVDHKVCRDTMWRLLREENKREWLRLRRPALTGRLAVVFLQYKEYRRSILVYHASRKHGILGLEPLAKHYVEQFGEELSLYDVLRLARDVFSTLPEGETWLPTYIKSHLLRLKLGNLNTNLLELYSALGHDHHFDNIVMKMVVDMLSEHISDATLKSEIFMANARHLTADPAAEDPVIEDPVLKDPAAEEPNVEEAIVEMSVEEWIIDKPCSVEGLPDVPLPLQ
ncbi:hypothetical protein N7466_001457 [Penicillium verhagenii]|uniref:uncharacterized protein n=1 Tax=Penicillium verhagenii TaxID=1562060 RepID=UPI0025458EC3|nr:uncharacterized protein N7466_001457 [Penicillium verhagenii]KAJ5938323.1 hypothetical protein N7466_001457 [Penicillium verhagenii]